MKERAALNLDRQTPQGVSMSAARTMDAFCDPYPILWREARGSTADGAVTPEKTLAKQAAFDELCATYAPEVVRLAKFLAAKGDMFATGDGHLAFDPTHGLGAACLKRAQEMLDIANGCEPEPIGNFSIHEIRWKKSEVAV